MLCANICICCHLRYITWMLCKVEGSATDALLVDADSGIEMLKQMNISLAHAHVNVLLGRYISRSWVCGMAAPGVMDCYLLILWLPPDMSLGGEVLMCTTCCTIRHHGRQICQGCTTFGWQSVFVPLLTSVAKRCTFLIHQHDVYKRCIGIAFVLKSFSCTM